MSKTLISLTTILSAIFLLMLTLYIYVSNRDGDMALYSWLGMDYYNDSFNFIRNHSIHLPLWVKYNLTDGLWMLSYLLFMEGFWTRDKRIKWMFCIPIISLALILEILQFLGYFPGTGDILDIIFYIAAILLFVLLIKLKQIYYEKDN